MNMRTFQWDCIFNTKSATLKKRIIMSTPRLSIVIPVYNEKENVGPLHAELQAVLDTIGDSHEIIFVNDGSSDGTLYELATLPKITIISLNRKYGQAVALDAGFKAAKGEIVVSLDGDGQNDPADIPKLISRLEEGKYDVITGWRKHRRDSRRIRTLTIIGRLMRRMFISDVTHDSGCTLRAYRREAVKSLDIGGEMHRYILAILRWKGFRIGEMEVHHRQRMHGISKYRPSKAFRGFFDLVYIWFIHKYSQRPLHLFGHLSGGALTFGILAGALSVYGKLVQGIPLNRNGWFFLAFFFLLAGIMFFCFGVIIDLLIRIQLTTSPHEKRYYVREIIKTDKG